MRDKQEVRKLLTNLVNERLSYRHLDAHEFEDSDELTTLGLDSLDMVELWLATEDELKCSLDEDSLRATKTFGELVTLVVNA